MDAAPSWEPPGERGRREDAWLLAALGVAALGAALAVAPFRAFDLDRFFVPKELFLHVGALAIAFVLVARNGASAWTRADLALLAWVGFSVISMFGAASGWHALRAVGISASGALVFRGASTLRENGRGRAAALILAFAAVAATGTALAQAYGIREDLFAANRAPGGTLGNRNFIAHIAAMAFPMLLWLAATARSSARAIVGAVGVLALSAALVLSRTRAAWLSLALWALVAGPSAWAARDVLRAAMAPGRARLIGIALSAGVLLALVIPNSLDWRSDSPYTDSLRGVVNYHDGSGAGRVKQYANSLKMARAHPVLGVGPGNWPAEYPAFAARNDPSLVEGTGMTANPWPSSDWIAALSERGAIAAAALVAFVVLLLTNARRGWSDSVYSSRERLGALAGGSVLLVGAIEGAFDAVSLLPFPAIVLWGAAGALIPASKPAISSDGPAKRRLPLATLAALVWLVWIGMSAAKIRAMQLYTTGTYDSFRAAAAIDPESYRVQMRSAEVQAAKGYCRLAYHDARSALQLFPHSPAAQQLVSRCASADHD